MKMIILAAGQGKRLRPITNNIPKCMVSLHQKPLIEWQIENAKKLGINKILITGGYRADQINSLDNQLLINQDYESTNMVYTLWCAREFIHSDLIISYGDIYYERRLLEQIKQSDNDISVAIDKDWLSYWKMRIDDPTQDAESLKLDRDNNIQEIGQPILNVSEVDGQYVGLMKFSEHGSSMLYNTLEFIQKEKISINGRDFGKMYMTDVINYMIHQGITIKAIPINRGWVEIDNKTDLDLAIEISYIEKDELRIRN